MSVLRGDEFLESLKDGREVWLRGEKVKDVTTHPALAGCARTLAEVYDLHHDPAYRDFLTMPSPTTGQVVNAGYLLPHSTEDLVRRRKLIEFWAHRCGAVAGRIPEYQAIINVGMYDNRNLFAEEQPEFADHVARWFEYVREHDLLQTHGFGEPPRDRARPPSDYEVLQVVERRADGIVVRGMRAVATIAPYAHEFLCLTSSRRDLGPGQLLYFAVPLNTKGLRVVCRQPLTPPNPEDHPLSPFWDEMDALVIFDDVFVPWERVFYLGRGSEGSENLRFYQQLFQQIIAYALWHILVRLSVKVQILVGLCGAIADYMGTTREPQVQLILSDAITYVETLRALIHAAETQPILSPSGLAVPNPTYVTVGRVVGVERLPQLLQTIRELCGAGILMAPGQADLNDPEIGPQLYRYYIGKDERAPERLRLLKLAWEYACDSFGARQLLFEMYNAASLSSNKMALVNSYDLTPLMRLAKGLAGIPVDA